jgi:hypothetical protein
VASDREYLHEAYVRSGSAGGPLSRAGILQKLHDFIFRSPFLSGHDSGLALLRRALYRLVIPFPIPAYSPRDKRGKSGSRKRRLGIEIRACFGTLPV